MAALLIAAYFATLGVLACLGLHRVHLVILARRAKKADRPDPPAPEAWPSVVVQLPIYNEAFVAERAIRAAARLEYPRDRLEVQVLDDSTDETTQIALRTAEELSRQGTEVSVVRRESRAGFKAGALAHGLERTKAELVAIFDADFVPRPGFLLELVPHLVADSGCGMVQARWAHLNRETSVLTRAQAILLDAHFGVEHEARSGSGRCFNFNGTAGIWRRRAIEEAGGWSEGTITEDLDLSYRAQLAGWRFSYLDQVLVPSELPESWSAFRTQQARWVRGSVETFRKHARAILSEKSWGLGKRFEAFVHLFGNFAYLLMALLAILLPLAVIIRDRLGWKVPGGELVLSGLDLGMLASGTLATIAFYLASMAWAKSGKGVDLAFALCLGAGMSLSNAVEVLRGLTSERSEFVRTPKRGDHALDRVRRTYRLVPRFTIASVEIAFAGYFAFGIGYALLRELWGAIPFLLLYFVGFSAIAIGTLRESRLRLSAERTVFATSDRRA
jgi:cellulose synthase/poly-beta-1,6-N-acetylglucosamine synthase-like glycosyltransferase